MTASSNKIPTSASEVDKAPTEGLVNHINYFFLSLGSPLTTDASVTYQTRDGSAKVGSDYVFTSGTAYIRAGSTSVLIGVEIIGDALIEQDEDFYLVISNPVGGIFPVGVVEIAAIHTIVSDDFIEKQNISIIGQSYHFESDV